MGITLQRDDNTTLPSPPEIALRRQLIFDIGEVLSDAYEIRLFLGGGGMGQVFEAYDRALSRFVAIKTAVRDPNGPSLRKEAQAMAVFRHPGLVSVHDFGSHRGIEYLVMERARGSTLTDQIAQRRREKQPFTVAEVLEIVVPLSEALDVVHRAGIVHRDIKPGNIMIEPSKRVLLVDFGIFLPERELTPQQIPAGTPPYMAPEAIRGMVVPGQGHLLDIFALGVLTYELLVGEPPFRGTNPGAILTEILRDATPRVSKKRSDVSDSLADLVSELLCSDPSARPQSVEDVMWRLRAEQGRREMKPRPRPFRVLIVDDESNIRSALCERLSSLVPHAEVAAVPSAKRAMDFVRHNATDAMLLDLGMPNMGGVELCMYLRGAHVADRTEIIVVSGRIEATELQVLQRLGVKHFIRKGPELTLKLAAILRDLRLRAGAH
jgi:serine/threonine-protein kinase